MEIILTVVFLICVFVLPSVLTDYKFSNRMPPSGYQVDHRAMNHDLAMGKSKMEVMRKCNNGGYDVKKK